MMLMIEQSNHSTKKVTGLMYAYSFLCERKLWYFANQINMEEDNEYVSIGKIIDEESYSREKKHIFIDDNINIDYIKDGVICEIKKSSANKQMAINQIKFYLYHLKKKNIDVSHGILSIPKEKHSEKVYLSEEDIPLIEERIKHNETIILYIHQW